VDIIEGGVKTKQEDDRRKKVYWAPEIGVVGVDYYREIQIPMRLPNKKI